MPSDQPTCDLLGVLPPSRTPPASVTHSGRTLAVTTGANKPLPTAKTREEQRVRTTSPPWMLWWLQEGEEEGEGEAERETASLMSGTTLVQVSLGVGSL